MYTGSVDGGGAVTIDQSMPKVGHLVSPCLLDSERSDLSHHPFCGEQGQDGSDQQDQDPQIQMRNQHC